MSVCLCPICSYSMDLTLGKGVKLCVTGEVSGNDKAPSLRGSQALAEMEAAVVATAEVKLDFGWKGKLLFIKQEL